MALQHKCRGPRRHHCQTRTTWETCHRTRVPRWGCWLHPRPTGFLVTHSHIKCCIIWRYCSWNTPTVAMDQASVHFSPLPPLLQTFSRLTQTF
jgi:hypothetical protein